MGGSEVNNKESQLINYGVLFRRLKPLQPLLFGSDVSERRDGAERKQRLWSLTASRSVNQADPRLTWAGPDFSSFNRDRGQNLTSVARPNERQICLIC